MTFSHQRNWIDCRLHIHIRVFKKHCCDCSATFHAWHHPIHIFTTITGRRNVSIFASQHPDLHWNNFPEWRTWAFHLDGNKINSIHFFSSPPARPGDFHVPGKGIIRHRCGLLAENISRRRPGRRRTPPASPGLHRSAGRQIPPGPEERGWRWKWEERCPKK